MGRPAGLGTDKAVKQGLSTRQMDEVVVFNLAASRPDLLTGVDPATGAPATCGAAGVDINCAVLGFTARRPRRPRRSPDEVGYDLIGGSGPSLPAAVPRRDVVAGGNPGPDSGRSGLRRRRGPALRPPAVLAKAAASLDLLSGGRFELGIGADGFLDAANAMGAPARTRGESLAALEEAVAVIRAIWSGQRGFGFDGRHDQLAGVYGSEAQAEGHVNRRSRARQGCL